MVKNLDKARPGESYIADYETGHQLHVNRLITIEGTTWTNDGYVGIFHSSTIRDHKFGIRFTMYLDNIVLKEQVNSNVVKALYGEV
jgi:hypothetical protein